MGGGGPLDRYLNVFCPILMCVCRTLVSGWDLQTIDQVIEELLHKDICCSIALPRLPKRVALEDSKLLKGPRISMLDEDWDVRCCYCYCCSFFGKSVWCAVVCLSCADSSFVYALTLMDCVTYNQCLY